MKNKFNIRIAFCWLITAICTLVFHSDSSRASSNSEIDTFRVAVVMPFELKRNAVLLGSDTVKSSVHPSSMPALHFYEGIRLALDSLKVSGNKITVSAYDLPTDLHGLTKLIAELERQKINAIVGTFPDNLLTHAIQKTGHSGIGLILTQTFSAEPVAGNSHCVIAYASTLTQCRRVIEKFHKKYPEANYILVKGKKGREPEIANAFKSSIIQVTGTPSVVKTIDLNSTGISAVSGHMVTAKTNIILFVSSDEPVVNPGLSAIEKMANGNTIVCGLPTWQNFESIDFMSFENFRVAMFENNPIDYNDQSRIRLQKRFVNQYFDDPLVTGFAGFDIMTHIIKPLSESKISEMEKLFRAGQKMFGTPYRFSKLNGGGLENTEVVLSYLIDYSFIPSEVADRYLQEIQKKKIK